MKIDRPKVMNTTEPTTSETANEAVQPEKSPAPKTDSVEMKVNSFYNFDQPKLDPSQSNIDGGKEVPSTLIPGVPFREKVEIAKTLPDGQPVDGGLNSDPGIGKSWKGPNRMGVDMGIAGLDVKNQLDEALKLREGSDSSSSKPSAGSGGYQPVTANDIGTHGKTGLDMGLNIKRGSMDLVSAEKDKRGPGERIVDTVVQAAKDVIDAAKNVTVKDVVDAIPKAKDKIVEYARDVGVQKFGPPLAGEAVQLLDAPGKVKEVTGDEKDLVRGMAAAMYPEARLDRIYNQSNDNKYVNPEGDSAGATVPTDELMKKVLIREGANTTPTNEDTGVGQIDESKLQAPKQFDNPRLNMVINPQPEDESAITPGSLDAIGVMQDAKGPDTVNPDEINNETGDPKPGA